MLKIILADNQAIFRAGIAKVLAVEDDMRIVAQAQTVEQAMIAIDKFRGSVMIYASEFLPEAEKLAALARESAIHLVVIVENNEQPDRYLLAGERRAAALRAQGQRGRGPRAGRAGHRQQRRCRRFCGGPRARPSDA